MTGYSLTIRIAPRKTPLLDDNGQYIIENGAVKTSLTGHIWFEVEGPSGLNSYGFAPVDEGYAYWPGEVKNNDNDVYDYSTYEKTITISQQQYETLRQFGANPEEFGFSKFYDGIDNSCVDFVFKALEIIGLNPKYDDGDIWPTHNVDEIESLTSNLIYLSVLPPRVKGAIDQLIESMTRGSPLVLDLDGIAGVQTVALNAPGTVYWDIDNDGFREASGWVSGNDGLLTIDLNADGKVNNNSELFGNTNSFANGFAALDAY